MDTRTDLIHRTLRNLGALPQGQCPSAEESQSIDDLIEATVAGLSARGIAYINTDYLQEEHILPLAHCVAWAAAPEFGQDNNAALAALKERAEMDFKEMVNVEGRYLHQRTMRTDYYPRCRTPYAGGG